MATVKELLQAAVKADAAGDEAAARMLVQAAKGRMGPDLPENGNGGAGEGAKPPPPDKGRFGDTAAEMIDEPLAAAREFAKGTVNPRESGIGQQLAAQGSYIPVWSDVGVGLTNAGLAGLSTVQAGLAGAAGLAGDITGLLGASETSQQQLADDLMGMVESTGGTAPAITAQGVAAGRAAGAGMKAGERAAGPLAAAREIGVTPSLRMTGKAGAMLAAGLEKIPFAGRVSARDAARAVSEVEGAFRKAVAGGVTPGSAGEVLQRGLTAFVDKFKERSGRLYDDVAAKIPRTARMRLPNMANAIAETKQFFTDNPELARKLGLNNWDGIVAEANAKGVSWQGVRQLRTQIGEAIGTNRGSLADEDVGRLKQLYGALTQDMEIAAKAAGPEAFRAWGRANAYYKSGADRIERSLDATITAKSPERAFEAFAAITKADRSSTDLLRLRKIKASMSDRDWTTVSTSIAERLGKARAGAQNAEGDAFSPAAFLTEWNKLDPQARKILFREDVRTELEKVAKVAEAIKAGNLERNVSNTGTATNLAKIMIGVSVAPTTTAATVGGAYLSARAMTSPFFLRALNSGMKGDTKALEAMAKGRGPLADDARILMQMATVEAANSTSAPRSAINQ